MVGVACHEVSSVHKEQSEVVVAMAASLQSLVVGGKDKQLGADYQIMSKWSPHKLSVRATVRERRRRKRRRRRRRREEEEEEKEEEEKVGKEWRRGKREVC